MSDRQGCLLGLSLCCLSAATVIAGLLFLGLKDALYAGLLLAAALGVAYAVAEVKAMPW